MLVDTFPELFKKDTGIFLLSPSSALFMDIPDYIEPEGYWDDPENRRRFLLSFAEKEGFDPLQPTNWCKRLPRLRAFGVPSLPPFPLSP